MPNTNPNLGSFLNPTQFSSNIPSANPLYAGILAGSTFNLPAFSGVNGAAEKDPGGLFGWLIYARNYKSNPVIGSTADKFIVYSSPSDFIADLNKLSGVTHCLISYTGSGGTHGFFDQKTATSIFTRAPLGNDFLHCLHYLSYGGNVIIAGTTTGLNVYETNTNNKIDVLIGNTADSTRAKWLIDKEATIGIFGSGNGNGKGETAADFTTLFGSASLISGSTIANRIFNIYGYNGATYSVDTLQTSGILEYDIPAVADVAGAFNISKNLRQLFLTVAGLDRSQVLNGQIANTVNWSETLKTTLKTNRVNFYVNNNPVFLGSDLVGATGSTSAITVSERIGAAFLRVKLTEEITEIGTKYLFELNEPATREQVTSEVQQLLDNYSYALAPTGNQVICNGSNNTDYSSALNIDVVIKPILGIDSFVINVSLTA